MLFNLNIDYSKRIFGLDLLRALAIIDVVRAHGNIILRNIETDFPWIKFIPGVTLFFVLSGFLIGSILIKIFENEKISFSVIFSFLKRRWFRTLPNYYLILILNIILVYFGVIKEDFTQFNFSFFFFSQNLFHPFHGFFWESWSITIEEWFYLSFPFLFAIISILLPSKKVKVLFLIATIIYLITPPMLRYFSMENSDLWGGNTIKGTVIYYLDSIAYGILGAYLKMYCKNIWEKYKVPFFIIGLLTISFMLSRDESSIIVFEKVFSSMVLNIGILLIFPLTNSIKTANTYLVRVVTHISMISYSMYLINLAIVAEVIRDNFMPTEYFQSIITYVIYWTIVIVLSTILYKFYEKPFMDLRDKKLSLTRLKKH